MATGTLNLKVLTDRELAVRAERDVRYNRDPLFTELVLRCADSHKGPRDSTSAELIDARR